ncbi:MAG: type IV secretion system protein VirB10 [Steroidobacteraceae bacterium]
MIRLPWRKGVPAEADRSSRAEGSRIDPRGGSAEPVGARDSVQGERGSPIVSRAQSLQSRMSSLLAAAMMVSVGAGLLTWYYAEALSRPTAARAAARASIPENAGEGMTLPSFAAMAAPAAARSAPAVSSASSPSSPLGALPNPLPEPPLARAPRGLPRGYGMPPQPSPRGQALERRLSGEVFAGGGGGGGGADAGTGEEPAAAAGIVHPQERTASSDALQTLLRPSELQATRAQVLPTRRLLLPQGTFIDCTLETAIDSTLPGMTTCVTATDTFGADGTVVLLERGTKLIGETRGAVSQGQARVFVVWTQARTPTGVVVRLDSPGTDALGRSGLKGKVNRHFWQRFGAAALVSTIDGAVQAEVQSSSRGGTVVLDPTASEDVLTELLRSTINIPPTIRVRNGARIQVLVARDVDFRSVYELEPR